MQGIVLYPDDVAKVRIQGVTIDNFKGVEHGHIDFDPPSGEGENAFQNGDANIVGIFGQNGSGKTALLEAMDMLQHVLSGGALAVGTDEKIRTGTTHAHFEWVFELMFPNAEKAQKIVYSFDLISVPSPDIKETGIHVSTPSTSVTIENEKLVAYGLSRRPRTLIDTSDTDIFRPQEQVRRLTDGGGTRIRAELRMLRRQAAEHGHSFIFSPRFLSLIGASSRDREARSILCSLMQFGYFFLRVVTTRDMDINVDSDRLPIEHRNHLFGTTVYSGKTLVPIDCPFEIGADDYKFISSILDNISAVLECIVPGHRIALEKLEETRGQNNEVQFKVQVISECEKDRFPFRYESGGIKKIVAILELLIAVYSNPGFTLAVDELDSGIFEYLLGELLRILASEGEGQLIFTSHNLRPLEVLPAHSVVFTTTDRTRRYIRPSSTRRHNDLRKLFYRDIALEVSQPTLYTPTRNAEIALALQQAGEEHEPEKGNRVCG